MNSFEEFDVEDFVGNDAFIAWCLKPDQASNIFWQQWLESHPGKKAVIHEARNMVKDLHQLEAEAKEDHYEVEMWTHFAVDSEEEPALVKCMFPGWVYAAAAGLAFLLAMSWWVSQPASETQTGPSNWLTYKNDSGLSKEITLSDQSSVTLEPFSSLKYPRDFEKGTSCIPYWRSSF